VSHGKNVNEAAEIGRPQLIERERGDNVIEVR
jgi:hypothetical protein